MLQHRCGQTIADIEAVVAALAGDLFSWSFARCMPDDLIHTANRNQRVPVHPKRATNRQPAATIRTSAKERIESAIQRTLHGLLASFQEIRDGWRFSPHRMKPCMAEQPTLFLVRQFEAPPVLRAENLADSMRLGFCESGAVKLVPSGERVGHVVIAEKKDVLGRVHSVSQPHRSEARVGHVVVKVVEEIAEENHAVMRLRLEPMLSVFDVVMKVRNDQRLHLSGD